MDRLAPRKRVGTAVRRCRGSHRPQLVALSDVGAAGFPVGAPRRGSLQLVLHRGRDGHLRVVDDSELRDLPEPVRRQAISLAAAVVGGLDLVGRTVTALQLDGDVRWSSVWRAHSRRTNRTGGRGRQKC